MKDKKTRKRRKKTKRRKDESAMDFTATFAILEARKMIGRIRYAFNLEKVLRRITQNSMRFFTRENSVATQRTATALTAFESSN
jgi:UTP:GlnB (protein PII) uridylyltransferase